MGQKKWEANEEWMKGEESSNKDQYIIAHPSETRMLGRLSTEVSD